MIANTPTNSPITKPRMAIDAKAFVDTFLEELNILTAPDIVNIKTDRAIPF